MDYEWNVNGLNYNTEIESYPIICGVVIRDATTHEFIKGMKFYGDENTIQAEVGVSPDGMIYFKVAEAGSCNIHVVNTYGTKYIISAADILGKISAPSWVQLHEET